MFADIQVTEGLEGFSSTHVCILGINAHTWIRWRSKFAASFSSPPQTAVAVQNRSPANNIDLTDSLMQPIIGPFGIWFKIAGTDVRRTG